MLVGKIVGKGWGKTNLQLLLHQISIPPILTPVKVASALQWVAGFQVIFRLDIPYSPPTRFEELSPPGYLQVMAAEEIVWQGVLAAKHQDIT